MTALHELTAVEAAALIAAGELTSVELTGHYLDRIAAHDDRLGAYVAVTAGTALEQAAEADAVVKTGRRLGPLHGVPVAVKDNVDVEDVPTTWGSVTRQDDDAVGDDHVVTRLRAAGLPILGKTHLPEFALPCYTENGIGGNTRNPWSDSATPGGSSGGSAAAVAAGLASVALGTDAGGSVRIPASCCGLTGMRPSNGLVSGGPGDPAPTGLSAPGVLGRTGADVAALLGVIAGTGPGDITGPRHAPDQEPVSGPALRVGVATKPMAPDVVVSSACEAAVATAASVLRNLGHEVVPIELGEDIDVARAFRDTWSVVAASFDVDDDEALMPFTRMMREHGRAVSGVRVHDALTMFRGVAMMLESFVFESVDVLLTPTLASPPPSRGPFRTADEETNFDLMGRFMPYTPMYNVAGMPSVTVPMVVDDGLPVGVLLGSVHGRDTQLLRLAEAVSPAWSRELAPGWSER
jgi:amidase